MRRGGVAEIVLLACCCGCGRAGLDRMTPAGGDTFPPADGQATADGADGGDDGGDAVAPVVLEFTGPQVVPVGACSNAFAVSLVSAPDDEPRAVTVSASLAGVTTFADAACTTPAAGLFVSGVGAAATFQLRGVAVGQTTLTARAGASEATRAVEITTATGWVHLPTANQPGYRNEPMMAPDGVAGGVLLYGGVRDDSEVIADLWRWDGAWSLADAAPTPGRRSRGALLWDEAGARHLLIGGTTDIGGTDLPEEIYQRVGALWSEVVLTSGSFVPRAGPGAAYDPVRGRAVIVGGWLGPGVADDAVYELTGTTLVGPLRPSPRPSARTGLMCAFVPTWGEVACYGGITGDFTTEHDDLWTWDGSRWLERCATCSGVSRDSGGLAYHEARAELVLFTGWGGNSLAEMAGTWVWSSTGFTLLSDTAPGRRDGPGWAYDPSTRALVTYGGDGPSCTGATENCNDTWLLY